MGELGLIGVELPKRLGSGQGGDVAGVMRPSAAALGYDKHAYELLSAARIRGFDARETHDRSIVIGSLSRKRGNRPAQRRGEDRGHGRQS